MKNNKILMSNKHNTLDLALVRIHKIVINIYKFLIKYIFLMYLHLPVVGLGDLSKLPSG